MKGTLLAIAGLVWSASAAAQGALGGPRLTVIFEPRIQSASPATREQIESALRDSGAVLVPPGNVSPAAIAEPPGVQALARRLGVDGVVEVRVQRHPPTAQVRVLDAKGAVRLTNEIQLPHRRISDKAAKSLAIVVVGAVTAPEEAKSMPPPPLQPPPAGGPENEIEASDAPPAAEATTPTPPPVPLSFVPAPRADTRRTLVFWAAGTGTWRSAQASSTATTTGLHFGSNAPYAGLAMGFETEPFLRPSLRWLGFDTSYAFSYTRVTSPSIPNGQPATEHRFLFGAVGQAFLPGSWGMVAVRVGGAYEGFIVPFEPPLVATTHFGLRLVVDYQVPIYHSIMLDGGGGVRPVNYVGQQLTELYGPKVSSFGEEAHAFISGSLDRIFARLRWTFGYEYLHYSDRFGTSRTNQTPYEETYNRLVLGLVYLP